MRHYIFMAAAAAMGAAMTYAVPPLGAQQSAPAQVNGCIYISGGVTLANLQTVPFQCDINGRLLVRTP